MSARLRGIARETEEIVAAGRYAASGGRRRCRDRRGELAAALAGTRMYGPEAGGTAARSTVASRVGPLRHVPRGHRREQHLEAARRLTAPDSSPVPS